MNVTMLLADSAQVADGKLYVLGGGWSLTGPDPTPSAVAIKLEDAPTPPKITKLLAKVPGLTVYGGLGGVSAFAELSRGAAGTMTGFAYPEMMRDVVAAELWLREPTDPGRLNGSGLLVVNPPWRFEEEAEAVLAALLGRLGEGEAGQGCGVVRLVDE